MPGNRKKKVIQVLIWYKPKL